MRNDYIREFSSLSSNIINEVRLVGFIVLYKENTIDLATARGPRIY